MAEALKTVGVLLGLFVVLPILILSIVDRFQYPRKRRKADEREAEKRKWIERLRCPQFADVERICGGVLPRTLKVAYEQGDLVLAENVEFAPRGKEAEKHSYWIQEFVPMDAEGQAHTTDLSEFGRGCCFAADGMGNFYWTPASDVPQDDAPVYFACHDPYGNQKVADTLQEFFGWLEAKP